MVGARTRAGLLATKAAGAASRLLGRGGGTAVGGLVGLWVSPSLVTDLARGLTNGSVLITGTNGKTTTSHLVAAMALADGLAPVANASGSNLMRGIAGALAGASNLSGVFSAGNTLGVFEVDEAVLPAAMEALKPRAVVVLDLFRDQLDRYGEVAAVASRWRDALATTAAPLSLVLNADDPAVAALGEDSGHETVYFGVNDPALDRGCREHAADALTCPCGTDYEYGVSYFGHLGHWRCPACGRARPSTQVTARDVDLMDGRRVAFTTGNPDGGPRVEMAIGGLYNVYNAVAAIATGLAIGLSEDAVLSALSHAGAAFGRQEVFEVDGRRIEVFLGKNPAGLNQVLATLARDRGRRTALFVLNDGIADGRDVSWIWDADYEALTGQFEAVVVAGKRAEEMALRLKYAEWPEASLVVEPHIAAALDRAIAATPSQGCLTIVPTYTAMLELRELLAKRSGKKEYWRI